jgi:hypothetical protein
MGLGLVIILNSIKIINNKEKKMKEVEPELYEFLKNNETTMYTEGNDIVAAVFVYFRDLEDFAEILGSSHFDDGGVEVTMMDGYVCFPLNDYIEGCGHYISSYRSCFANDVWQIYGDKLIEIENRYR